MIFTVGTIGRSERPLVRFAFITDSHYAPHIAPVPGDRRRYGDALCKMRRFAQHMNRLHADFVVEGGDFKDLGRTREESIAYLDAMEGAFALFRGPRYHVLGNHDHDNLSKDEFLSRISNDGQQAAKAYYSFERGGVKFIVLNACFDSSLRPYSQNNPWNDANVPPRELAWFEQELAAARGPVVVFCHQRLDDAAEPNHLVRNAKQVRQLIEANGKVRLVVTGHQHCGGYHLLNGIPYYSLRALVVDSGPGANSFAEVAVYPSGAFAVTGWRNAVSVNTAGEPA